MKIAMEERRLLLAQRNLESIRLIAELLTRAKVRHAHKDEIYTSKWVYAITIWYIWSNTSDFSSTVVIYKFDTSVPLQTLQLYQTIYSIPNEEL